jgi:hypothetical protein
LDKHSHVFEEEVQDERLLQAQVELSTATAVVSLMVLQLTQAKVSDEAPIAILVALSHEHSPVNLLNDIVPTQPQLFCMLLEAFKNALEVVGQFKQFFDEVL